MTPAVNIRPRYDSDILAGDHFGDMQYRLAALKVANRIRKDLGPVSYTHLDVYKRQVPSS